MAASTIMARSADEMFLMAFHYYGDLSKEDSIPAAHVPRMSSNGTSLRVCNGASVNELYGHPM